MTESEDIKSRAKQRAQEIQKIQADAQGHVPGPEQDLGSPAEDDGADAITKFAHEVKRAEARAIAAARLSRTRRPR
jgi:hypothetical protein